MQNGVFVLSGGYSDVVWLMQISSDGGLVDSELIVVVDIEQCWLLCVLLMIVIECVR